jgi:hypothetical protein
MAKTETAGAAGGRENTDKAPETVDREAAEGKAKGEPKPGQRA